MSEGLPASEGKKRPDDVSISSPFRNWIEGLPVPIGLGLFAAWSCRIAGSETWQFFDLPVGMMFDVRPVSEAVVFLFLALAVQRFGLNSGLGAIQRWRNNYRLPTPPFTAVEGLAAGLIAFGFAWGLFNHARLEEFSLTFAWENFRRPYLILLAVLGMTLVEVWTKIRIPLEQDGREEIFNPFSDDPVSLPKDDFLYRDRFAERIYRHIEALPEGSNRFVIGLYGGWGEGKTSVLNLLGRKIDVNPSLLVVRFNPWHFNSARSVTDAFLAALSQAINSRYFFHSITRLLRRYSELLSGPSRGLALWLWEKDANFEVRELKLEVQRLIRTLGRRIVVFVDDMDRLEEAELRAVFRLVNLVADFENIIFVLSFDPVKVALAIDDGEFIEKIVQQPFTIPKIPEGKLDKFLDDGIDTLLADIKASPEERKEIERRIAPLYSSAMRPLLGTLRKAKRYLAILRVDLPTIRREVNIADFLLLQLIKLEFPILHADIWASRWLYVDPSWARRGKFDLLASLMRDQQKERQVIREHIEQLVSSYGRKTITQELLGQLFPRVQFAFSDVGSEHGSARELRERRRVAHPDCLKRYFLQTVEDSELSDEVLDDQLAAWQKASNPSEAIGSTFKQMTSDKLTGDFMERMLDKIETVPRDLYKPLILALSAHAMEFSIDERGMPFDSELRRAWMLIIQLIKTHGRWDDATRILVEVIENSPSIDFSRIVAWFYCSEEYSDSEWAIAREWVDRKKLLAAILGRLRKALLDAHVDVCKLRTCRQPIDTLIFWSILDGKGGDSGRYLGWLLSVEPLRLIDILDRFEADGSRPERKIVKFHELANCFDVALLIPTAEKFVGGAQDQTSRTYQYAASLLNQWQKAIANAQSKAAADGKGRNDISGAE